MTDVVFLVGVFAFPMFLALGVIGWRCGVPQLAGIIELPSTPPLLVGMATLSLGWVLDAVLLLFVGMGVVLASGVVLVDDHYRRRQGRALAASDPGRHP